MARFGLVVGALRTDHSGCLCDGSCCLRFAGGVHPLDGVSPVGLSELCSNVVGRGMSKFG